MGLPTAGSPSSLLRGRGARRCPFLLVVEGVRGLEGKRSWTAWHLVDVLAPGRRGDETLFHSCSNFAEKARPHLSLSRAGSVRSGCVSHVRDLRQHAGRTADRQ